MSEPAPMNPIEPRPMSNPGTPAELATARPPPPEHRRSDIDPSQGIALRLGPENQIPDHPASAASVPRPGPVTASSAPPGPVNTTFAPPPQDVRNLRASVQYNLREYLTLRNKLRQSNGSATNLELEGRFRYQAGVTMGDLRSLQSELRGMVKAAENHRWRRWVVGGGLGAFVPLVRKLFKRKDDKESQEASNDTEYAFHKSKGLISRIKDSLWGHGGWASLGFFVFAVLYVFQNEVTLRVAKTLQKRVRKLCDKVENGQGDFEESDMKLLEGWRWRVLLWG